ncbi:hypothetical protein BJ138DRAFT_1171799 [Hygrophoropsis aurantiaca]|uniref:Uncharacterized protein n=1 Tax=Hygrophoropsis aurantiaca TaxID=72124 RepID=A0ACB8AIS0_9AGAM|nr:hypothetical protein BJ138DRAFT_1171799 [Hygrophoropsis aurantiaca]
MSRSFNVTVQASRQARSYGRSMPSTIPGRRRDIFKVQLPSSPLDTSIKSRIHYISRGTHSVASEQNPTPGPTPALELESHSRSQALVPGDPFVEHLNSIFPPLQFPPPIAQRILTHGSHKAATHGHNGRFSFMGRRVLETYFLLFLHSAARNQHHHDYELLASQALNTYLLGEHVASKWSLGRILRWTPTVSSDTLRPTSADSDAELETALTVNPGIVRSVGLYKVMGDTVQAVMGGVYHQFGGSVAHRVFHTRLLPHILLPGKPEGVPAEFHQKALDISERMGGMDGDLLVQSSGSNKPPQDPRVAEVVREIAA